MKWKSKLKMLHKNRQKKQKEIKKEIRRRKGKRSKHRRRCKKWIYVERKQRGKGKEVEEGDEEVG